MMYMAVICRVTRHSASRLCGQQGREFVLLVTFLVTWSGAWNGPDFARKQALTRFDELGRAVRAAGGYSPREGAEAAARFQSS